MSSFPMDEWRRQTQQVTIEFDSRGKREQKTMTAYAGRSFFARMLKAGRNPRIVSAT